MKLTSFIHVNLSHNKSRDEIIEFELKKHSIYSQHVVMSNRDILSKYRVITRLSRKKKLLNELPMASSYEKWYFAKQKREKLTQ